MTLAQDALAAAHQTLLGHFPTPVTYTPPGGTVGGSITVVINPELDDVTLADIGPQYQRAAVFLVRATAVALPMREGIFTVASGATAGTWIIRRVRALTGGNWECACGADLQQRNTHPAAAWPGALG